MSMTNETPMTAAPPLIPKGRIGRFVYEKEIGQGSMGIVYLFRDPVIGRNVAIKVLNPQLPSHLRKLFEENFIQEARAAGRLNHPNIVTVHDADKTGDLLFIVMEHLEGNELSELIEKGHQFSYKQIAELIGRVANALHYAHENGVIHRDIKPANIFITASGTPKVLDFGIARASRKLSDADQSFGQSRLEEDRLMGTPNYMSPEQTRGGEIDARADIFSLGVVLYHLLCGELPFKAHDVEGLLHAIAREPAVPPQEIRPDVPLRLARIAAKAIAKKPADRYQHANEMAQDLNRYLEKERAERLIAKIQQPEQPKSKLGNTSQFLKTKFSQTKTWIIASSFIVAAGLFGWWTVSHREPKIVETPVIISDNEDTSQSASAPAPPTIQTSDSKVTTSSTKELNIKSPATLPAADVTPPPPEKVVASKPKTDKVKPKTTNTPVKAPPTSVTIGSVQIAVSPWGEVFVDGHSKGVAPPLARLTLPSGKHRIEIKNGDDVYVTTIDVSPDQEVKINHRF
jgi:eukaryotic-like serine/threonine-protein kinase